MTDVKQYRFVVSPISGSNFSSLQYSANPLKGQLERVNITSSHAAGSVLIYESGTNATLLTFTTASGTNPIVRYPRTPVSDSAGTQTTSASGNIWTNYILNTPVYVAGSGLTSGTSASLTVDLFYR